MSFLTPLHLPIAWTYLLSTFLSPFELNSHSPQLVMAQTNDLVRQHTHDIELGYSEALQRHITRHVVPPKQVSQRKLDFEHRRPRILREMMAEATGVFFYVFPGIASVASVSHPPSRVSLVYPLPT